MIFVIATIELKPGKREAFLAEFNRNVPNVRAEKGCLEYGPTVDVKTDIKAQIPLRENVVTIVEKWETSRPCTRTWVPPTWPHTGSG